MERARCYQARGLRVRPIARLRSPPFLQSTSQLSGPTLIFDPDHRPGALPRFWKEHRPNPLSPHTHTHTRNPIFHHARLYGSYRRVLRKVQYLRSTRKNMKGCCKIFQAVKCNRCYVLINCFNVICVVSISFSLCIIYYIFFVLLDSYQLFYFLLIHSL